MIGGSTTSNSPSRRWIGRKPSTAAPSDGASPTWSEHCEFDGRMKGGFTTGSPARPGGPLVILYAEDLADAQRRVEAAGGRIAKPIFDFPGGRRFHFLDPDGYELAVWSKQ
jgi:predicted enzyme related to lactoylglutathione lyase